LRVDLAVDFEADGDEIHCEVLSEKCYVSRDF
jgi:hypothetical protein